MTYVAQLPKEEQQRLKTKIQKRLMQEGIHGRALEEEVERAMNSKVTDLEELWKGR